MTLDLPTLAIIVGWVVSAAAIVWTVLREIGKTREETAALIKSAQEDTLQKVSQLYAKNEDMRVLETKFENMRETLVRIETGIKEIKIKLEVI